jgi:peptide/nickel transport system ATP-binding protein
VTTPVLEVKDLRVHFFLDEGLVRAVDGVSFDVLPGQVVGIVGESGCGKSVTMKAILQIVEPPGRIVGGQILFQKSSGAPVDLAQLSPKSAELRAIRGAEIALIPQEPMAAFSPVHSVGEQVIEALRLHERQWRPSGPRLSRTEARSLTVDLFRSVGISMPDERVDAYSWQLSGGLRQRAMIAMALACGPALLIADEPTTALDVTIQAQILDLLRRLQAERGMAVLLITHDLGVVAELCHRVAVIYAGRIVEMAPVASLFARPLHPYTRGLLQCLPHPSRFGQPLASIEGVPPDLRQAPAGCRFAPRCSYAVAACRVHEPQLEKREPGHFVACPVVE